MPNTISDDVVNRKERSYHQNKPTTSGSHFYAFSSSNAPGTTPPTTSIDPLNSPRSRQPLSALYSTAPDFMPPFAASHNSSTTQSGDHLDQRDPQQFSSSYPALSYSNLVTYDSSFSPHYRPHPQSLCVYCSNTLLHSAKNDGCPSNGYKPSPNLISDDVLYRKIKQSSGARTPAEPQPQFGIPNTNITSQLNDHRNLDYSRLAPEPRPLHNLPPYTTGRSWNKPHRMANPVNDDLAFRSLRKDIFDRSNWNSSPVEHIPDGRAFEETSFPPVNNTRAVPPYYKKLHKRNRVLRKFSFTEDSSSLEESEESPESTESFWSDSSILI